MMNEPDSAAPSLLRAVRALWWRELVRFYRQPSRVVGALSSPLVFWLVIGSGLGSSFDMGGAGGAAGNFREYFYPGILALILLFTAIFSTVSIIQDRAEGFLQAVLVAPASRTAIAGGKILGAATLAVLQGAIFLPLAPLAGFDLGALQLLSILSVMTLLGFALAGLGFLLAWRMESVQGFHVMMNLLLIPLWLLSGAFFPASGAAPWIRALMAANPLTYGVEALHWSFYLGNATDYVSPLGLPFAVLIAITVAFGAVTLLLSGATVRQRAT